MLPSISAVPAMHPNVLVLGFSGGAGAIWPSGWPRRVIVTG